MAWSGRRFCASRKLLAFARRCQFINAARLTAPSAAISRVQAVDLACRPADGRCYPGCALQRLQVGLGVQQQLVRTAQPQRRGLFLELEFGDALALGSESWRSSLQAALVAGAQAAVRSSYYCAARAGAFRVHLERQRVAATGLGCGIGQSLSSARPGRAAFRRCRSLLVCCCGFRSARAVRRVRACRLRWAKVASWAWRSRAAAVHARSAAALGPRSRGRQLGVALLAVGQLHVQFFKLRFGGDSAFLQVVQLGLHFGQVGVNLALRRAASCSPVATGAGFHLQLVGRFCASPAARGARHQPLATHRRRRLGEPPRCGPRRQSWPGRSSFSGFRSPARAASNVVVQSPAQKITLCAVTQ